MGGLDKMEPVNVVRTRIQMIIYQLWKACDLHLAYIYAHELTSFLRGENFNYCGYIQNCCNDYPVPAMNYYLKEKKKTIF